jgi:hypothetical protein
MLELFGHHDHIPSSCEYSIVTLTLPELDVEFPVRD